METWKAVIIGILPSIGVGLVFWYALRAVIRADRNERAALAELDAQADAAELDAQAEVAAPTLTNSDLRGIVGSTLNERM